ncbi:MAG: PD-(D/E)XK nuclease family protein [Flavobacterium sp.]
MDKLKNLLNQVAIIQKKYDELAEYSGEHYNVFDILGVTANELSHSAILTNLLNAKGKHGQKDLFLKIFLNLIKDKFEEFGQKKIIENFDTNNSVAVKEKYAGKVNYEAEEGGKIDIVINDGKNNIIIENKIYAGDQPKQLVRYNQHDKNAPIIYLTLMGDEPIEESKGTLKSGGEYICVDYQNTIKDWLELSIKEMANKPIIRETLNQYVHVIKNLTNQSINNKMSEEIIKTMKINILSSFEIAKNMVELKKSLCEEFLGHVEEYLKNNMSIDCKLEKNEFCLTLVPETWKNREFEIYITFENSNYNGLYVCIKYPDGLDENHEVRKKFKDVDKGYKESNWGAIKFPSTYAWADNPEIWNSVSKGKESREYKEVIEIIEEILEIYNS